MKDIRNLKESQELELKSEWSDESLRSLCAFANTDGGKLILGIDDKGKILGIKNSKKLLEDIPNKINSHLGIIPKVTVNSDEGKEIISIEIPSAASQVSYKSKFYVRSGSTNQELNGDDLTRFLHSKNRISWEGIPEEKASIKEDINLETIEKFKNLAVKRFPLIRDEKNIENLLRKLNLIEGKFLKRAAILLFGNNPKKFYISAIIRIGKFLSDTNVISTDEINGNLFEQSENALEILKTKYLVSKFRYEGIYRKEDLEYPEEALKEAIINSIIHKDYLGPHIQLRVDLDKLSLWNAGTLSKDLKIEDLKKVHKSSPRNKIIAEVFFKAGLIENWGRGTVDIIRYCKAAGLPEPEFIEEQGGFTVNFYKDIYNEENLRKMGLSERQINAVKYVKENNKTTNLGFQNLNQVSKPTATRDLEDLVFKNIFERIGNTGKGTHYKLKNINGLKGLIKGS